MTARWPRKIMVATAVWLGMVWATGAAVNDVGAQGPLQFERDVWPILAANCVGCHGGEAVKGGLDLRTVASLRRGGKGGPALDPSDPGSSLMLERIARREMPPGNARKLSDREVAVVGSVADDLCLVRSMYSDNNNHPQATRCLLSGKIFPGRPSVGSWISYALGTENQNLPAYVVLRDPNGYNNGGTTMWESGWLPATYQGTEIQSRGAAVLDLHPAVKTTEAAQRDNLHALASLNEARRKLYPAESILEARIRNYELAARMQLSAEQVLDIRHETAPTRRLYGLEDPVTANFGTRCLMARRLVESGVRFVQVMVPIKSGTMPWDHHENIKPGLEALCPQIDHPHRGLDPRPQRARAA